MCLEKSCCCCCRCRWLQRLRLCAVWFRSPGIFVVGALAIFFVRSFVSALNKNIYVAWNIRNKSSTEKKRAKEMQSTSPYLRWCLTDSQTKKCVRHSIDSLCVWIGEIDRTRPTVWLPSSFGCAQMTDNECHKHVIHFSSSSLIRAQNARRAGIS